MKSTTPRIKGAKLITTEEAGPYLKVDVWQGVRGYYVYFHYLNDNSLVLARGPFKELPYALRLARSLRDVLKTLETL